MLSRELQIGKAAEHLACADLIIQGHNAFLSDAGLPYDLIVDLSGQLIRVQCKGTTKTTNASKTKNVYRFGLRSGNARNARALDYRDVDCIAIVALDRKLIGYIPTSDLRQSHGRVPPLLEIKTRQIEYSGRRYDSGRVRVAYGRFLEDFARFPVEQLIKTISE